MITNKRIYKIAAFFNLILLVFVIISTQKEWIKYIINQKEYEVVEATITDEKHVPFKRKVILRYEKDKEKIVIADIRDSVNKKVAVAIDEKGEILRTSLYLPADLIPYYGMSCFVVLFMICCFGYKKEREIKNGTNTYDDYIKKREMEIRFANSAKSELQLKMVLGIIAFIIIILCRIFL